MAYIPSKKEHKDQLHGSQEEFIHTSLNEKKELDKSNIREKILLSLNLKDNIREARLKELKERIKNNNYHVSSEKIAISMLKDLIKDAWFTK